MTLRQASGLLRVSRAVRKGASNFSALLSLSFLLFLSAAPQENSGRKRFVRFINDSTEYVEVVAVAPDHVLLRFEEVPGAIPVRWWELHPSSAAELRGGPPASANSSSIDGTMAPAIRIRTTDGKEYSGVLLLGADEGRLWIRKQGVPTSFDRTSIAQIEDVKLPLRDLYTEAEILEALERRMKPVTAEEWEQLAQDLATSAPGDRLLGALWIAHLLRRPELPEGRVHQLLIRSRDSAAGTALPRKIQQIQEALAARGAEGALELLPRFSSDLPPPLYSQIRKSLEALRRIPASSRVLAEWPRMVDVLLHAKALDRSLTLTRARSYVETTLAVDVENRMKLRHPSGAREVWNGRPTDGWRKHALEQASPILDHPDEPAAEAWWNSADPLLRKTLLYGFAVRRHFDVQETLEKNCPACGATGMTEGERCTACGGSGKQIVLIYR